jgi:hypothetical protein
MRKPGMHFRTYRSRKRTLVRVRRPQLFFRPTLGYGLRNRQRVPYRDIAKLQYRNPARRRERLRGCVGIKDDPVLIELDACFLEQQPRAQRPR